jgi:hypothetical protein
MILTVELQMIFHTFRLRVFMICCGAVHHTLSSSVSSLIASRPKFKEIVSTAAMLLSHVI